MSKINYKNLSEIIVKTQAELDMIPDRSDTSLDLIEEEMAERDGQNTDKTIRFVRRTLRNITMRWRGRK